MGFLGGSVVKNPSVCAGDLGSNLGREDPLEKEMATHSSILAWEIPWAEEPGGLQSMGSQRVRQDLAAKQQQQLGWGVAPKDLSAGLSEATACPLTCEVIGPRAPHP